MARSIMVQGTTSNAGKSLVAAGLCRIFSQDGYRVAPFKSQNMALNSFVTADGLEMGRAQVMQAEAAGREPEVRMNPILLKPTNDTGSQVIVNGEVVGTMGAREYYAYKERLRPAVVRAYESLAAENDVMVLEGAGSPAEINLSRGDFVNMGMAKIARAPVLLVGDINPGGVFAALYGTVKLLPEDEQRLVKAFVINKFRGDESILRPGFDLLRSYIDIPVAGVVPYLELDLDDEDSLAPRLERRKAEGLLDLAVIRLPHISNFTDFVSLGRFECASVRYVSRPDELGSPDLILLPGTKNTMGDLLWLRQNGLEARILRLSADGTPVVGVCGGYQMLGERISDPYGVEHGGELRGMGLLPGVTEFAREKTRTRRSGTVGRLEGFFAPLSGASFEGYEIHMGRTDPGGAPFASLSPGGGQDGCAQGAVFGSYVHGLFDEGELAEKLVALLLQKRGITAAAARSMDFAVYKQTQYDLLAAALRKSLDMKMIYRILDEGV
jgi:adenosylcobyric acid synthase